MNHHDPRALEAMLSEADARVGRRLAVERKALALRNAIAILPDGPHKSLLRLRLAHVERSLR